MNFGPFRHVHHHLNTPQKEIKENDARSEDLSSLCSCSDCCRISIVDSVFDERARDACVEDVAMAGVDVAGVDVAGVDVAGVDVAGGVTEFAVYDSPRDRDVRTICPPPPQRSRLADRRGRIVKPLVTKLAPDSRETYRRTPSRAARVVDVEVNSARPSGRSTYRPKPLRRTIHNSATCRDGEDICDPLEAGQSIGNLGLNGADPDTASLYRVADRVVEAIRPRLLGEADVEPLDAGRSPTRWSDRANATTKRAIEDEINRLAAEKKTLRASADLTSPLGDETPPTPPRPLDDEAVAGNRKRRRKRKNATGDSESSITVNTPTAALRGARDIATNVRSPATGSRSPATGARTTTTSSRPSPPFALGDISPTGSSKHFAATSTRKPNRESTIGQISSHPSLANSGNLSVDGFLCSGGNSRDHRNEKKARREATSSYTGSNCNSKGGATNGRMEIGFSNSTKETHVDGTAVPNSYSRDSVFEWPYNEASTSGSRVALPRSSSVETDV